MKILKKILPCLTLILTLFLTGCTNQSYSLIVNSDDSSTLKVKYVVDSDTYDLLDSYDLDKDYNFEKKETSSNPIEQCDVLFQETAAVFSQYGFRIKPVNDAVEIGFEAEKQYASIDELNKDLPSMYNDGLINFTGEVKVTKNLLKKEYLFSGKVKYLLDPDTEISEEDKNKILDFYDPSSLHAKVSMRMPGDLVAHDGKIEEGMAIYTATYNDNKEVPVHLKTKITNKSMQMIIITGGIVIVAVGGLFVSRFIRKKKEQRNNQEMYEDETM